MGIGNQNLQRTNPNQVYYDPAKGQYYTISNTGYLGSMFNNRGRNYIGAGQNQSQVNSLVQQAMNAQPNTPSLAQLFPYMNYGATNNMGANMGGLGGLLGMTGSSGAGRFLGNPSSTNSTTM
jgi:hypothetical protein